LIRFIIQFTFIIFLFASFAVLYSGKSYSQDYTIRENIDSSSQRTQLDRVDSDDIANTASDGSVRLEGSLSSLLFNSAFYDAIAWPFVALLILWVFRKSINNLLSRLRSIKTIYGDAAFGEQSRSDILFPHELIKVVKDNSERYETIVQNVKILEELMKSTKLDDDKEKVEFLSYAAIYNLLRGNFEAIYGVIYGTQIQLLQHLSSEQQGEEKENLRKFYNKSYSKYGLQKAPFSFDQYLGYLVSVKLIELEGTRYKLTPYGKDFLTYIDAVGKIETRIF